LNYWSFDKNLEIFENNEEMNHCKDFECEYKYKYLKLIEPVIKDYIYLNEKYNIIIRK